MAEWNRASGAETDLCPIQQLIQQLPVHASEVGGLARVEAGRHSFPMVIKHARDEFSPAPVVDEPPLLGHREIGPSVQKDPCEDADPVSGDRAIRIEDLDAFKAAAR